MAFTSGESPGIRRWLSFLLLLTCIVLTITVPSAAAEDLTLSPGLTLMTGEGWSSVRPRAGEAAVLLLRGSDARLAGRAVVTIESRRSANDAIAQLVRHVPSGGATPTISEVAGLPTVMFTQLIAPDESEDAAGARPADPLTRIVTLVVIESRLVRIAVTIGSKPGPGMLTRARALAGWLRTSKPADAAKTRGWLASIRAALRARSPMVRPLAMGGARRGTLPLVRKSVTIEPSTATAAGLGRELEIAVSPDGQDIVIGMLGRTVTSNDGGVTFAPTVAIPPAPVPGGNFGRLSDPSVARAPSGRFYLSYLGRETFPDGTSRDTVSVAVSEPPQRGNNFSFLSHVVRCADDDVFSTDQPHMTVDPRNRAGHADQIYVGWRKAPPLDDTATCSGGTQGFETMLTCSPDGGATWPTTTFIDDFGMYPRVAAGHDGMVYVVSETARHDGTIWLTKLSSCEDGLKIQEGFPVAVTDFIGVRCRVPGLDRCNNGNIQASPTVAVGPARPRHVFVAYADRTAAGNEDIVVRGSLDGGETWTLQTTANAPNVAARRYMPWLCAAPGQLFVSWYDRRSAVPASNDLTQYFVNLVRPIDDIGDSQPDRLSRAVETSVSAVPDPQCRLWPSAPRDQDDAEKCAGTQLAGLLTDAAGTPVLDAAGNQRRCDFSDTEGVANRRCITGNGSPKYGDYTGNACTAGRAFLTWASATNPEDGSPLARSGVFFATADAVTHTTVVDLCSDNRCGGIDPGSLGELLLRCPRGNCRVVASVPEICKRMVDCPGCRPDGLCPQEFTFEVDGLNAGWALRIVDEEGRAVHGSVRWTGTTLAVAMRPGKAQAINGRVGRYFLVLERNGPGPGRIAVRLRVSVSAP